MMTELLGQSPFGIRAQPDTEVFGSILNESEEDNRTRLYYIITVINAPIPLNQPDHGED